RVAVLPCQSTGAPTLQPLLVRPARWPVRTGARSRVSRGAAVSNLRSTSLHFRRELHGHERVSAQRNAIPFCPEEHDSDVATAQCRTGADDELKFAILGGCRLRGQRRLAESLKGVLRNEEKHVLRAARRSYGMRRDSPLRSSGQHESGRSRNRAPHGDVSRSATGAYEQDAQPDRRPAAEDQTDSGKRADADAEPASGQQHVAGRPQVQGAADSPEYRPADQRHFDPRTTAKVAADAGTPARTHGTRRRRTGRATAGATAVVTHFTKVVSTR